MREVTEGGVDGAGVFHKISRIDDSRLTELFAREVLADLVRAFPAPFRLVSAQFDKRRLLDLPSPTMGRGKTGAMNALSASPAEKQIIINKSRSAACCGLAQCFLLQASLLFSHPWGSPSYLYPRGGKRVNEE